MRPHRTDHLSLFFGLLFLLVSVGYLLRKHFDARLPEIGWFIAGGLIFLGLVMAVTALTPDRKQPVEDVATPPPGTEAAEKP